MKKSSGVMGGLYRICEWIMRFAVINLVWLVFNIPIIFILLNMVLADRHGVLVLLAVPLVLLLPVLFFPATTAMFAAARNLVMNEEGTSIGGYWKFYKENYKKSFLGGLLLTSAWLIWAVDYYYFSQENVILMAGFLIMGVLLYVYTINFFSVISHYHLTLWPALKNTLVITIGSPVIFFTVLISNGIILYLGLFTFQFMLPFFTGSLIAYLSFSSFYRFYLKVTAS
nr:DUF624 domain-containing protein [Neobacillus sp. Marseille-Q6967]